MQIVTKLITLILLFLCVNFTNNWEGGMGKSVPRFGIAYFAFFFKLTNLALCCCSESVRLLNLDDNDHFDSDDGSLGNDFPSESTSSASQVEAVWQCREFVVLVHFEQGR